MPKVSVLTPVYNTEPAQLRECIDSILGQTFTDFEFIILNDSPDNTEIESIVKSYKDKRIKYHKNTKNIGITESRNKLMGFARGDYLAIFDHDDISLPMRLEKQVAYLDANPDVGAVSSNALWFPQNTKTNFPTENLDIKKALMLSNVFAHTAMMVRKSVLTDNGIKYEEAFSPAEDYMLALRMVGCTMLHVLPDALVKYRFESNNTTNKNTAKMANADMLCRNYAAATYPYLFSLLNNNSYDNRHYWIRLFDLIPIVKVKIKPYKIRWYLFGVIPVLAVKR